MSATVKEIIEKYANSNVDSIIIEESEIPNIDLYMDQVTTFMDQVLQSYKRNDHDKILTKTMINNYTKAKILPPPVKKKYTKTHIMLLIIIYHLKSILSIRDIETLLSPILPTAQDSNTEKITQVYICVTKIQQATYENMKTSANGGRESLLQELEIVQTVEDETLKKILLILLLTARAYAEKRLAESILDHDF
ncbi:MAG: DUF1836 domain-containing protein [Bacillota bacterium]